MTKNDDRVIVQSQVLTTLQNLNKEAYEKRKLAPVTEFADDDWRMLWLVVLIEDKLKWYASLGHHEIKFKSLDEFITLLDNSFNLNDFEDLKNGKKPKFKFNKEILFSNYRDRISALAKKAHLIAEYCTLLNVPVMEDYWLLKNKKKIVESYASLRILVNYLSPEEAVDLKRYLCFKFQSVLIECKVFSLVDMNNDRTSDLKFTFAW